MITIITAGIAPGFALLSYFYLRDKYVEPVALVFRMFLFGGLSTFPVMFIQFVCTNEALLIRPFEQAFLQAGLIEEFAKWFILFYGVYKHAEFNEPFDGIVYGASVSLGFATVENILYLFAYGVDFAFMRAFLPVSGHALFGVVMGYYVGKWKFAHAGKRKLWMMLSLMLPVFLHGTFDYLLLTFENYLYYVIPFMVGLWWLVLYKVRIANEEQIEISQIEKISL
ncbi:MAG TPA: glutamic-type intramembrane protease PrsW [Massilibacterium sp.]|nr:glutamic-type intramembrane protease PrsW [Massilibacterium sp.]